MLYIVIQQRLYYNNRKTLEVILMTGNVQTIADNSRCEIDRCLQINAESFQVTSCNHRFHLPCLFESLGNKRLNYIADDESSDINFSGNQSLDTFDRNRSLSYDASEPDRIWCPICPLNNPNRSTISMHLTADQIDILAIQLLSSPDNNIQRTAQSVVDWKNLFSASEIAIRNLENHLRSSLIQLSQNTQDHMGIAGNMLTAILECPEIIDPQTRMVKDYSYISSNARAHNQLPSEQERFIVGYTNELIESENKGRDILEDLRFELENFCIPKLFGMRNNIHLFSTNHKIALLYFKLIESSLSEEEKVQIQVLELTDQYIKDMTSNARAHQNQEERISLSQTINDSYLSRESIVQTENQDSETSSPAFEPISFSGIDDTDGRKAYLDARLSHNVAITAHIRALVETGNHDELQEFILMYADQADSFFASQNPSYTQPLPNETVASISRNIPLNIPPPDSEVSWMNWIWDCASSYFNLVYKVITWPYNYFFESSE